MASTKIINRREEDFSKRRGIPQKIVRNYNPVYHPFQRAREYTKALNATKLERIFAKPFVAALSGCSDSIWRLAVVPKRLALVASGDCSGELRVWNASKKALEWRADAHEGFVRGLCATSCGETLISVGSDQKIKVWSLHSSEPFASGRKVLAKENYVHNAALNDVDCQWEAGVFATAGEQIDLWNLNRSDPIHSFACGESTNLAVAFNKVETNLLFATASDRRVVLFDVRCRSAAKTLIMKMVANSLCWNPMEAFNFTLASEDSNLYTFDMRFLEKAKNVHEDHLNAVMSVDYSPTGLEFVSGSYDKTVRLFRAPESRSREVYHAKRMQRVFATKFSLDGTFVYSGSDDTNIRVWKANASEKLGTLSRRETEYFNYSDTLKEKYKFMPEIKRILRHRHLPKNIYKDKKKKMIMEKAKLRREKRAEVNSMQKSIKKDKNAKGILGVLD